MAREAWIAGAFFPLGALAVWSEAPALTISAAGAAGLFFLSQAMILKEAKGIPAWRTPLTKASPCRRRPPSAVKPVAHGPRTWHRCRLWEVEP